MYYQKLLPLLLWHGSEWTDICPQTLNAEGQ